LRESFFLDQDNVYRVVALAGLGWLEHGFGTRQSTAWNDQQRLAALHQVHSDVCLYAAAGSRGRIGTGDALITNAAGVWIGVRTADCIPILIADLRRRAVAAIHAGWRGTLAGVASRTIEAMRRRFATSPEDLAAAIGPGIGPCCYEVGSEVASQFASLFPERRDLSGRTRIDLAEANRRQLAAAGVPASQIWTSGMCTCCLSERFFSWRRESHRAARMVAAALIHPQENERRGD